MEKILYLCEGARIVINKNLNADKGIYNAASGTIHKIVFENYEAKYLIIDLDTSKLTTNESFEKRHRIIVKRHTAKPMDQKHSRTQFPINLAYAMTIHKVQGQTLDKVRIDFGDRRPIYGLATVALSRTKKLDDMLIERLNEKDIKNLFTLTEEGEMAKLMQEKAFSKIRKNIRRRTT